MPSVAAEAVCVGVFSFVFFRLLSFSGAKVLLFFDICKKSNKKSNKK